MTEPAFNPFAGILAPEIEGKRCRTCRSMKPWDAFYRSAERADGHQQVCKACQDARIKRNRAATNARYARNPGPKLDRERQRYARDPELRRHKSAQALQRYYDTKAAA